MADPSSAGEHASGGLPQFDLSQWPGQMVWMLLIVTVAYLMVSTWRFYSFKDIDFRSRQPFRLIVLFGALFAALWYFSQWVLFLIALLYMVSGVLWRVQWMFRRKGNPPPPAYKEASQTS